MSMKVLFPENEYIKKIEISEKDVDIEFSPRLKIALLFISLNHQYWPYLKQVVEDCKKNFLPHHNVDYFVWTDIPEAQDKKTEDFIRTLPTNEQIQQAREFAKDALELQQTNRLISQETIKGCIDFIKNNKGITVFPTEPIEWPHPTLMRYHLFLQQEEKLKEYDHILYLDADMRVVEKISDEVLSDGLLAAEHPMYSLKRELVPPYEPNKESAAYIPRPGKIIDENGKKRFKPFYYAGGFQGGRSKEFIEAMKVMRDNIDKDFNKNYTAIWNDESHWNRYLFDYQGPLSVMPPSYVYPDSLQKEYYEPIWGRSYEPKIVTLTKPFSLSKEAGEQLRQKMGIASTPVQLLQNKLQCEKCNEILFLAGHHLRKVITCEGGGKPHQVDTVKL